jgi:hypothetical protein
MAISMFHFMGRRLSRRYWAPLALIIYEWVHMLLPLHTGVVLLPLGKQYPGKMIIASAGIWFQYVGNKSKNLG